MKIGEKISLSGKTLKGKNRIREHGSDWTVVQVVDKVAFSPKLGPWLMVTAEDGHGRWVNSMDDTDFIVWSKL